MEKSESTKRSNIGKTFTVRAEVTKSMIEDLSNQHGFDMVQRLKSLLVIKTVRESRIKKILSKI